MSYLTISGYIATALNSNGLKIIILYFIQIRHTDDFPSMGEWWPRIEDSGGGSSTGRQRRVATLTPEIRETRKRERVPG